MNAFGLPFKPAWLAAAVAALFSPAAGAVDYVWTAGDFVVDVTAPSPLVAPDTLAINAGTPAKRFAGLTFINQSSVIWNSDNLGFVSSIISNTGLWDAKSDHGFVMPAAASPVSATAASSTSSLRPTWCSPAAPTRAAGPPPETAARKNFTAVAFTNHGTLNWQSVERIGFVSSNVSNTGLWDIQSDADLLYAGGGISNVVNSGTFRKSGGSGVTEIGTNIVFANTGVIDVRIGTLVLPNNFINPGVRTRNLGHAAGRPGLVAFAARRREARLAA